MGVKASPEEIYRGLTETEKLALCWTTDTRGSGAKVGDTLEFWFYGFCQKFNVEELEPGKRVVWKSPKGQGADEWEETEVTFDLSTDEKQTFIQFRHSGWREEKGVPTPMTLRSITGELVREEVNQPCERLAGSLLRWLIPLGVKSSGT